MIALLRDTTDRNSISIRTELDPQIALTMADRVQLQQVLMNLMLNGIEAMKGGSGALTIASKQNEDGQLMVSVSDLGLGLPVEGAERIFETFFTTKPDGTGIGLPLSRRIIEFAWRPSMGEREHAARHRLPFHAVVHFSRCALISIRRYGPRFYRGGRNKRRPSGPQRLWFKPGCRRRRCCRELPSSRGRQALLARPGTWRRRGQDREG